MKKFCFLLLIFVGISACHSDSSLPVSVRLDLMPNQFHIPNNPYTPAYFNSVIIQATTDQVTVENIVINRGQCPLSSWRKRMSTLKFGQSFQSVIDCNIEQVREVTVKTNQGEFTFNF
ncbi:hypothetical protein [Acinetobacter sp. DSM 11652]|uniref:hypothetical protein n=1 Tax=Acinetobacter sp. DSM 11652 TaxID=346222 RepID=UPI0008ABC0D1|nr:hypothetical protein [Acinetobacter sp. DSM 11652]SEL24156.1 hypothetical protein SAMN05216500_101176 [Acinetobacter sp. DSM 11652]